MPDARPTLALIHGLGASRRAWEPVLPLLAEAGLRAVPVELPGYGEQRRRAPARTIEAMADAAAERIRDLGPGRVTVVGHSMGGLVATALAERTDLPERIVVVNSSLSVASRLTAHRGSEGLIHRPVIGRLAWRVAPRSKLRDGLRSAFAPGFAVPDVFVDDLRACSWATFTRSSSAMDTYLGHQPLADRLAGLSVPVHLIYGTQDLRIDAAAITAICDARPGTVTRIDAAGHTPMWETPGEAAQAIIAALRQTASH